MGEKINDYNIMTCGPPDFFTVKTNEKETVILDNIRNTNVVFRAKHTSLPRAMLMHAYYCRLLHERRFHKRNLQKWELWGQMRYWKEKGRLNFKEEPNEKPDGKLFSFVETL